MKKLLNTIYNLLVMVDSLDYIKAPRVIHYITPIIALLAIGLAIPYMFFAALWVMF